MYLNTVMASSTLRASIPSNSNRLMFSTISFSMWVLTSSFLFAMIAACFLCSVSAWKINKFVSLRIIRRLSAWIRFFCIHTSISALVTFARVCFPPILILLISSSRLALLSAFLCSCSCFFLSCSSWQVNEKQVKICGFHWGYYCYM